MEGTNNGHSSHAQASDSSVKSMEIKIKTLDSQVYTCNVDQNISVPALKEQIATLTGVPVENQRLICRGKVLKDSHNLSTYNVEDGHTLHLVTRQVPQPGAPSSSGGANVGDEEQGGEDPSMAASRNRPTQIAHSVVMGTFNVPDNGDGGLPDVNRILSSVLQSLGIANLVPNTGANVGGLAVNPAIAVPAVGGQDTGAGNIRPGNAGNQSPPLERGVAHVTWPTTGPGILPAIGQQFRLLQQSMVIPDALTTISQYLDGLEQALASNGQQTSPQDAPHLNTPPSQTPSSPATIRGHPTPANLGAVIHRTMHLINGQAAMELDRLSSQLENEANLVDAGVRSELQSAALRDGVLLQHLGALLLELGRATLTLRMGTTAVEAAVNPGPAVFISPAGPNPMMVQPLPFQPGAGFGTVNVGAHHNAGMMGFGDVPRNVSIHIHANDAGTIPGFPAPVQGVAPGNVAPQAPVSGPAMGPSSVAATSSVAGNITPSVHAIAVPMQVSGPSALSDQPGVRVVPMRTVVAAVPATRPLGDNTAAHANLLHPLLARFQQLNSQQGSSAPAVAIHGTPSMPPFSNTAHQSLNSVTPTIRAQVQVQAWVPDGQGGSRLVTNEEALRTLLTQTQQSSPLTAQQQPPQGTRLVSQSNSAGETNNIGDITTNENKPVAQQVSNDNDEPVGSTLEQANEAVRVVPSPGGVDNNSNSQAKDDSQNESGKLGSSVDVEMQQKHTTTDTPAGLGLRGLQPLPARTPKRPARQQHISQAASTSEQGVQNQNTSSSYEQGGSEPLAGGQQNEQGSPVISDTRTTPSQMAPAFQPLNSVPSRRGGGGNLDIGSLVSQFAASAGGITGPTRARDQDQGLGFSAGALSNLMGQVMQNPLMRNVVQQVVEQVGDDTLGHDDSGAQGASPLGGLDFSKLLQEMMPVVSQAINRVSNTTSSEQASSLLQSSNARTGGENGVARGNTEAVRDGSEDMLPNGSSVSNGPNLSAIFHQMMPAVAQAFGGALASRPERTSGFPINLNSGSVENGGRLTTAQQMQEDVSERDETSQLGMGEPESSERPESAPVAKRQKIDVERALEKLELGSSPDEILRVIAETASMLTTATNNEEADALLLAQYLCQDNSLVNDYMALLLSDLTSYNQEDNP